MRECFKSNYKRFTINQEWKWILILLEESFCHFFIHYISIFIVGIHVPFGEKSKKTNEKRLNCRVDIRFADELQSIETNVKKSGMKMNINTSWRIFLSLFYSLHIYFYCRYSYALRGKEQKSNQKTLVFDFQRSKLVSVIQCFKSFATQTVKHFNHDFQLFDTRLQIIWHFLQPFSIFRFIFIQSMSKNLNLNHNFMFYAFVTCCYIK